MRSLRIAFTVEWLACCAAFGVLPPVRPSRIPDALQEQRLLAIGRQAALRRDYADAVKCYQLAIDRCGSSKSFLCAALLLSKVGLEDDARECFAAGVVAHRNDATLLQAWGLFESKCGTLTRAVRLLQRAVVLDPSLHKVLSWSRFREQTASLPQRHVARNGLQPAMIADEDVEISTLESSMETSSSIAKPRVKYTVPQSTLGWKGRVEEGEDPEAWYDAEGRRNGPPVNYWRQSMDERAHARCLAAVDALLDDDDGVAEGLADGAVRALEMRMSIQSPMRNRKLLGQWAPILLNGTLVAQAQVASYEGRTARDYYGLNAPAVEIRRSHGRKTVEHRYGVIDTHLKEQESLTIQTISTPDDLAPREATFHATHANERRFLFWGNTADTRSGGVFVGGVTLLNDYLLVARDSEGALREVYVRVDKQIG